MLYNSILARSFGKQDQKILRFWAIIGCLVIALSFCAVSKLHLGPLSPLNLRESMGAGLKMLMVNDTSSFPFILKENSSMLQIVDDHINNSRRIVSDSSKSQLIIVNNDTNSSQQMANVPMYCNITKRSDFCEIEDEISIEANSGTVFISSSSSSSSQAGEIVIRPYARKADEKAMSPVRKWNVKSVKSHQEIPKCTQNHSIPAILFSTGGGYPENHFHDFTDIIIPLYSACRQFNGEVQFLVTNERSIWIEKFRKLLQKLSNYNVIDIDQERDKVHCFPRGIIGLKAHGQKEMSIDPSMSPYTIIDFRQFLRSCYSLQRSTAITINEGEKKRPRLLIISRKRTRIFTNVDKIAGMAEELGYKVVVAELDGALSRVAEIVNSCDVLVGVHGAGLTNIVFLPENAVLIQVIPIAVARVSRFCFKDSSMAMNLRYLDYMIKAEESSLIQQYPPDHQVIRQPYPISTMGWDAFKSLYMDKQNVQLDLIRFRGTLLKALELLHE